MPKLEDYFREKLDLNSVTHHWSGQILEPVDGLPYIGVNPGEKNHYVATGFSGNGMTFGTVAGILLADLILDKPNSWAALYRPSRIKPLASAFAFVRENKDFPTCFLKDFIAPAEASTPEEIKPGEGKLLRHHGKKIAAFRDEGGELHTVSSLCPHMGCHVHFNRAEKTWDCPCHGSRFTPDGDVLNGPAIAPLASISL